MVPLLGGWGILSGHVSMMIFYNNIFRSTFERIGSNREVLLEQGEVSFLISQRGKPGIEF